MQEDTASNASALQQGLTLSEHAVEWKESEALKPDYFDKDTWVALQHPTSLNSFPPSFL